MNRVELPEVSVSHPMAPHPMSEAEFLAWQDEDIKAEWVNGEVINPAWLWQDPLPNPLEILKELAVL